MVEDLIRYDRMVERALRNVVREALSQVAASGALPGEHHFFITFLTGFPGVSIPSYLRQQYPGEMTIVLQYQFSDLKVDETNISVTLSFNNKPERLVIPLEAVTTFADPAVSFALQFQMMDEDAFMDEEGGGDNDEGSSGGAGDAAKRDVPPGGAEVVALDAFRKK